jgi:hypothetical protein
MSGLLGELSLSGSLSSNLSGTTFLNLFWKLLLQAFTGFLSKKLGYRDASSVFQEAPRNPALPPCHNVPAKHS